MGNLVITVGREVGSGGKDIGTLLAKRLDVPCYDKELLEKAAQESGFAEAVFETHDEKPTNSFLYSLVMDTYAGSNFAVPSAMDMPLNHKVFLAQFDAIKKIAEEESCVMVGRCADYALAENPQCISVFVHADMDFRVKHICDTYQVTEKEAKNLITKGDKRRANYYNYYTNKRWGDSRSYDLCIDSGKLGIEGAVDMILQYVEMYTKIQEKK